MSELNTGIDESRLTLEQRQQVERHLTSKAALVGKCPVCSQRNWGLLDHLLHVPIYHGGSLVVGGPTYPHVGLICQNCGNTQLINAVVSGVLKNKDEAPNRGQANE
ncbi:hypothetical protein [Ensifer aridi]|uniref:hypothetical protein n=1 Tax=Ensifer aridi TaxID=1708715 RepID=UPI0011117CBC|nr:hypothetical protein [Ensifer aridi]